MKKSLLLLTALFILGTVQSQTWSDDVAQIIYDKCSKCHNSNGIAPFSLVTYSETSPMASAMASAINGDRMPPWPPNNNFQQYTHTRSLTSTEETTILDWIIGGTPEGIPANTPPPPIFPSGAMLGAGDLEIQIPTYMSKASISDDHVCFALPSNLATSRKIKSIEIVPGNREIVHHVLVFIDSLSLGVTDTIGSDCGGPSSQSAHLVAGYTPGDLPTQLPSASPLKLGFTIPANSQIYLSLHYPEGSFGQFDSTKVIFHFYPLGETGVREVYTSDILKDWALVLPADQITSVQAQYPPSGGLATDVSLLSVVPHMHLLGKSMIVYGIEQPSLDTLKLIDIPAWDFEWQGFYFYEYIQRAKAGTTMYADAVYDNTTANPFNPNSPPQTVVSGPNTTDEMLVVFMQYMTYQSGDEFFNLDSLITAASISELQDESGVFQMYPNPFKGHMTIYSNTVSPGDIISVYIYDGQGNIVAKLLDNDIVSDDQLTLTWDGTISTGGNAARGMYHVSINLNGIFSSQRVIRR